ncbi:tonB-system energizer ExbB [Parashewanella tropica]|uniref:tonB-system energizer ExbB n=1 Tax=Parashewanella tropica TaxID=2547970 RepID=UPI001059BC09|nr:tonB-system energizer ExbB [Parashewanella tropica]
MTRFFISIFVFLLSLNAQANDAVGVSHGLPADLSPWGMYLAADWVVKSVMILLLLASILTWGIFVAKQVQLYKQTKLAKGFLSQILSAEKFDDCKQIKCIDNPFAQSVIQSTATELKLSFSNSDSKVNDEGIKERVNERLQRLQINAGAQINKGTGILASVGSVAPFVGLFGTVWGIMNSFIGIAQTQTTNLAVVAPGIAEALLATAIGLVAAIPAVLLYNYFARAITNYKALLADISSALMIVVSRDLDKRKNG